MKKKPEITRCVEFRAADQGEDGDGRTLEGYAAVFNQDTEINSWEGHFTERLVPGAFKKTLRENKGNIVMQFNHGRDTRVGSCPIAAFDELREDDSGLYCKARMFDNDAVEPVRQAIAAKAIPGMSFRFMVVRDEWRDKDGKSIKGDKVYDLLYQPGDLGPLQRTIKEVRLFECGPVVTPAYKGTSVGVREADAEMSDVERQRRDDEYRASFTDDQPPPSGEMTEDEKRALLDWLDAERDYRSELGRCLEYADAVREIDERADTPKKPYGDVTYADPGYQSDKKKRYPLDTKDHVKAAWSYINMPKNAGKYSSSQLSSIKSKIKSAAKKFGIEISDNKKSDDTVDAARTTGTSTGTTPDAARTGTSRETEKETTRKDKAIMNVHELRARIKEIKERLLSIDDEHRDETLPDEAREEFETLDTELQEREAEVTAIEERAEKMKLYLVKTPNSREHGSDRGNPAFVQDRGQDIFNLEEIRNMSIGGNDFLERVTDNAHRAIDTMQYGAKDREAAQEHVTELLRDIETKDRQLAKRILLTGSDVYTEAFAKVIQHGSDAFCTDPERQAILRAQELGTDTKGGFAVPVQLDPTVIYNNAGVINPIRDLARVETIVGKEWQGVLTAGTTAVRGSETGAGAVAPDSSFALTQPTLRTNRVAAFVPFTYESELAWSALMSEITRAMVDAKATEENSFITGDGTGTNPGGVIATLTGNTVTAAGTASLVGNDVIAVQNALDPRWEPNAHWLGHKAVYNKIRQFDSAGGGMFWGNLIGGNPNTLLDYPIAKASAMASVLTTGSKILLYGDFGSGFLIVDRIGMQIETIPNLMDPTTGRPIGQRGVYAVWMNNSKILIHNAFKLLVTG